MDFAHIAPTKYISQFQRTNGCHLLLAHLVEQDEEYASYWEHSLDQRFRILDNSAFELYKEGRDMFDPNQLIDLGKRVRADMIVLPDYPGKDWKVTYNASIEYAEKFQDAGFRTMFVPQSEIGDFDGYMEGIEAAMTTPGFDRIGISILGAPNAFGVEDQPFHRQMARWRVFNHIARNRYSVSVSCADKFHCLGMLDGPNEIDLLAQFAHMIASWDSSAAVWAGINGVQFEVNSITGLSGGKYTKTVDFDYDRELDDGEIDFVMNNIQFLDWRVKWINQRKKHNG